MNWIRIATGIYRSDCSVGYLVERKGLGLFQRGWYRSWHLTDNSGMFLGGVRVSSAVYSRVANGTRISA